MDPAPGWRYSMCMETNVRIVGMSCDHCVAAVRRALLAVPGVRDARVAIGSAVIVSDAPLSRDALDRAITDEGYGLVRDDDATRG
jgi:copper chaperone CopZ